SLRVPAGHANDITAPPTIGKKPCDRLGEVGVDCAPAWLQCQRQIRTEHSAIFGEVFHRYRQVYGTTLGKADEGCDIEWRQAEAGGAQWWQKVDARQTRLSSNSHDSYSTSIF